MFKKFSTLCLIATTMLFALTVQAGNEYGLVKEIRYNTPIEVDGIPSGASMVVTLEVDPDNYNQYSEVDSCFIDGVQWYVNLDGNPMVVDKLVARLEKAEQDRTVVRLFGKDGACDSGEPQYTDTIVEGYFYR